MASSLTGAVVVLAATLLSFSGLGYGTVNRDTGFKIWPNPKAIPYYMDSSLNSTEQAEVTAAIAQIEKDLGTCIKFNPVTSASTDFKIKFTKTSGTTPNNYCSSNPGMNVDLKTRKPTGEQIISLAEPTKWGSGAYAGKADGCLPATNARCKILKYLANVLGKRNEHQRADRDWYITVSSNLAVPSAYRKYTTAEAYWSSNTYDFCSITHNVPTDYATTGSKAFTAVEQFNRSGDPFATAPCKLSLVDCQLISAMYGCAASCTQTACPFGVTATTTPTPAPACDKAIFCKPDTVLNDGVVMLDGKVVIFSEKCYGEVDVANHNIKEAGSIETLFDTAFSTKGLIKEIFSAWKSDSATLHVLMKDKTTQYSCTSTSKTCTVEKNVSQGVKFELFAGSATGPNTLATITDPGTGFTEEGSDKTAQTVDSVYQACKTGSTPSCTTPPTNWYAAWSDGTVKDQFYAVGKVATPATPATLSVPSLTLVKRTTSSPPDFTTEKPPVNLTCT